MRLFPVIRWLPVVCLPVVCLPVVCFSGICVAVAMLPKVAGAQGISATEQAAEAPAAANLDAAKPDAAASALMLAAQQTVEGAIAKAAPSVVAIARVRRGSQSAAAQAFNLPGFDPRGGGLWQGDVVPTEFGSGVIISEDGDILTCYHVIDDPQQNDYYVWYQGGQVGQAAEVARTTAEVRAGDPWTDLAVIRIEAENLPAMPMGDAAQLRRGSFVVSLGNPYATARDGQASASWGIVANLQRRAPPSRESLSELSPPESLPEFGTLIQTDARLNVGSSGGALINLRGEMVGLTTSLAAVSGYEQGAGYAIPIDQPTLATIAQLQAGRSPTFGFLGVEPISVPGGGGAIVRRVVPGMAAENAGLRAGDVIVRVDQVQIANAEDLFREMSRRPADATVSMWVRASSNPAPREITVRLGKKRLALSRPGFSQVEEPSWRGMSVDFASALPPDRLMQTNVARRGDAAVVRVDPDSPAWRAGARPGNMILRAAGQLVQRPDDFYQAVENEKGVVELTLAGRFGAMEQIKVPPPAAGNTPAEQD
ncbi:trypsin-like peptidase domain-containing protein [Planctomycetaceae bacterium SH139]